MVSLKSFKLIGEAELVGALESDQEHHQQQQQIRSNNNQQLLPALYSANDLARKASSSSRSSTNSSSMAVIMNNDQKNSTSNDKEIASSHKTTIKPVTNQMNRVSQSSSTTDQASSSNSSTISIVVVQHPNDNLHHNQHHRNHDNQGTSTTIVGTTVDDGSSTSSLNYVPGQDLIINQDNLAVIDVPMQVDSDMNLSPNIVEDGMHAYTTNNENLRQTNGTSQLIKNVNDFRGNENMPPSNDRLLATNGEHFEIVWSNLSYKIEPKWYKKINFVDKIFSQFMPGQTIDNHSSATSTASSSAGMNDNQHQMHHQHQRTLTETHPNSQSPSKSSPLDPIEIFTNLNGTIKSGQMTAVLGPSGAGKTTLLNCLTGKLRKGVSGHINLIGANGKHLKMCTIPQKVEENLWFASKIKNPEYGFDHVKNIERVVDLLGLKRCRSAKIKKISGGQHKRVSIAQELLSNPDILVLDEPTSGLDSLTCFKTISMLRDLVELSATNDFMKPMAIIVTIHQPQPKVFNLFHHVYILANGGRVIYEGAPQVSLETITSVTGISPIEGGGTSNQVSSKSSNQLNNNSTNAIANNNVDPASFLIEIASEEYGLEVIKTLNEHQRRVFYENNAVYQRPNHYSHHNGGPMINHGFTGDYNNLDASDLHHQQVNKKGAGGLTTIFVAGEFSEEQSTNNSTINRSNKSKSKKRKKSTYSLESGFSGSNRSNIGSDNNDNKSTSSGSAGSSGGGTGASGGSGSDTASLYMSEQLLYTREANHKGRFWSHTATLTHRTLLTIRRDPLLMTSRVLFHLMIPILMGHVYGKATGAANACPHYEPEIDITQIPSLVEGKRIEFMLEELHMSIENVSMFFIIMYAFAAAVLALNALSFPLNMQVLLKETRNGWYSMSSYVVAKTLADLPLELTMPCLTMALVYPLTGQPSSYLQWRMLTICLIMTLCSLIAQTQALILGALVMNSVQTAVFVSQASQLPWVILAGFTIRIKRLSEPLKLISLTSFYRLGCEAITLTRYGFGICPCDPKEISGEPVRLVGIPDQLRTLAQYWIDSMESSKANNDTTALASEDQSIALTTTTTMVPETTTVAAQFTPGSKTDIFQHLANQLSYANSYGVNITSCDDVAPDRIRAINLGDNWLVARIWHLFIMLIIMKILLYYAVKFSIGIRL